MWTKLSDDFGDDCVRAGLSDAAFRTHVEALLWSMRRLTDGRIEKLDLRRLAESAAAEMAVNELVASGFWHTHREGWRVVHAMSDQPESAVVLKRRADNARRQQELRLRKAGVAPGGSVAQSRRDADHDVAAHDTRDPGRGGTGRDGSGQASTKASPTENRDTCGTCTDPLKADGSCGYCGPRAREFAGIAGGALPHHVAAPV